MSAKGRSVVGARSTMTRGVDWSPKESASVCEMTKTHDVRL